MTTRHDVTAPEWPERLSRFRYEEWDVGLPPATSLLAAANPLIWRETTARRAWHAARKRFAARHGCKIRADGTLTPDPMILMGLRPPPQP